MLSATAVHALRALTVLARQEGRAMLGRDLSAASGVPANFLSKILLELKRVGIVDAVRGTGGGYRLRKPPESIHLVEVVRLFDPARANPECLLGGGRECSDQEPCPAHHAWREVRRTFIDFLDGTTLDEISFRPENNESTTGA